MLPFLNKQHGGLQDLRVGNADSTLRMDEWQLLDTAILKVAREELTGVMDLRSRGLEYILPNGMAHTVFQHQTQSDIGPAMISMDPVNKSDADRPVFDIHNLPLPVIHKDFHFTLRQLQNARNNGTGIDVSMAEDATRKVAEEAEHLLMGTGNYQNYQFGGGVIYGVTNFPDRLTYPMTVPTGVATNEQTVNDVLAMRQALYDSLYRGPYIIWNSPNWDQFLDADYSAAKGTNTLRERLLQINKIQSIQTVDYLSGFRMIMFQPTANVIREVVGMDITPIRWETEGGQLFHYKVMAIQVPQLRSDYNKNTGILDATAA